MNPDTLATVEKLEQAEWFVNVGRDDSTGVLTVGTWREAIASCEGEVWQWVHQEAAGDLTVYLSRRDRSRSNQWNHVVADVKKAIIPLIARKTEAVITANNLPPSFVNAVRWDVLHLCMELEYGDLSPPKFFSALTRWYLEGHFPCGWQGDYPSGSLVIY